MKVKLYFSGFFRLFVIVFIFAYALSGCGATKVALTRQTFDSVKTPTSVARLKTPDLFVPTWGGALLAGAGGVVPVLINERNRSHATEQLEEGCAIPDPGFEVTSKFMNIWRKRGHAPKMVLVESTIENNFKFPGASIVFQITWFKLGLDGYLGVSCEITMKNDSGQIIHTNNINFITQEKHSKDEFRKNNCKLLKEKIMVASQYIAEGFVKEIDAELQR